MVTVDYNHVLIIGVCFCCEALTKEMFNGRNSVPSLTMSSYFINFDIRKNIM